MSTVLYEQAGKIVTITINRPDAMNAIDPETQDALVEAWTRFRDDDGAWIAILTGAGQKSFCAGADLKKMIPASFGKGARRRAHESLGLGGITRGLEIWKPMIAAINGMACGGAFYMLGEVEFIIAAEHATFFDPHVTYGMTAAFEPIHMLQKMPFHEIMRLSLLGNYERLSAKRAYEIGLVSEVVPAEKLRDAAGWAARAIASQPPLAIQGTLRAIWSARELSRSQALSMAYAYVAMGTNADSIREGQEAFASKKRLPWKLR